MAYAGSMRYRLTLAALFVLFASACGDDATTASPPDGSSPDGAAPDGSTTNDASPDAPFVDAGPPTANVVPMVPLTQPAVSRGSAYRGSAEKFNRWYTDASYKPKKIIYVSPTGGGNGATKQTPTTVSAGLAAATPGTQVFFVSGTYSGCYEVPDTGSGTYDDPVILYGERNGSGGRTVTMNCCATGRQTCINLEAASYVAVDGFELVGGAYGVRSVGADYAASKHTKGNAVLACDGHDQNKDPFFTGATDWFVIERNVGHGAKAGDGHGIYLSNGSDWNIVRNNELYGNLSSDFQINADPASTCTDVSIPVNSPDCDAIAGTTTDGGRGASDFMLVESNFFHDGLAQGANFTSARNSIVRDNLFAVYAKHGVSFWQETNNPKLGASDNVILHNLFVAKVQNRQMIQFIASSDRNRVENNVFVGIGTNMLAMEVDGTVGANTYVQNYYINAALNGRTPNAQEHVAATLDATWFQALPAGASNDPTVWSPTAKAGFLDLGALDPNATLDRAGNPRKAPTDLGPFER